MINNADAALALVRNGADPGVNRLAGPAATAIGAVITYARLLLQEGQKEGFEGLRARPAEVGQFLKTMIEDAQKKMNKFRREEFGILKLDSAEQSFIHIQSAVGSLKEIQKWLQQACQPRARV